MTNCYARRTQWQVGYRLLSDVEKTPNGRYTTPYVEVGHFETYADARISYYQMQIDFYGIAEVRIIEAFHQ
jgi:hypothetical protein